VFRHSALGCGTTLQVGRLRVRFPEYIIGFFIGISFRPHCGPGVDSAFNRNEYQEYFLGRQRRPVRRAGNLTTLRGNCFEIWAPQPSRTLRARPGLCRDCFTFKSSPHIVMRNAVQGQLYFTKRRQRLSGLTTFLSSRYLGANGFVISEDSDSNYCRG
jgi:hypothetical protein